MNLRILFLALTLSSFCLASRAQTCLLRDNGATMTDPVTGIEIQKCPVGQTHTGGHQCTGTAVFHTFDQAAARYGQGAWRLITADEARSVFTRAKHCEIGTSWTSSPYVGDSERAWGFDFFGDGYVGSYGRLQTLTVRLVRASQSSGGATTLNNTQRNNGQANASGLQNQKTYSCESELNSLCQQLKGDSRCLNKSQFLEDGFKHFSRYSASALQDAINNFRRLGLEDPGNKVNHCVAQESLAKKNGVGSGNQTASQSNNIPQQSQQAQQLAQQNQARADQLRQGKRKTNDPAAQAHECIAIDQAGSGNFGAFKNTCGYKVNFTTCNYRPRTIQGGFNWSADFDCEKRQFGLHTPDAGRSVAAHNRNTEMVYWFACKAPATPVDAAFVVGKGIEARCHN